MGDNAPDTASPGPDVGSTKPAPGLLPRLHRAVQESGLIAQQAAFEGPARSLVVSSRLAQAALHHLQAVAPGIGAQLTSELASMGSADECGLLTGGRGYTFLHVVHFIYEFVRGHGGLAEGQSLPAAVGWEGSGLHLAHDQDVLAMIRLLVNAMPPGDPGRSLGLIVQTLAPLLLDTIFPNQVFALDVEWSGAHQLRCALHFADPAAVAAGLGRLGLEQDAGALFIDMALQIQETIRKGLAEIVWDPARCTALTPLLETRDRRQRAVIARDCRCAWDVTWDPGVRLRVLTDPQAVLAQIQLLHATLHRRDLEYFQERVKTLELRVQSLEQGDQFHDLIGRSPPMQRVYRVIQQVAATDATVLIRGESGTGKELVARAIHQCSPRAKGPFVAVNCAAFNESLLESELFGHEKGAFTGADRTRQGRFELADGGTLFLDEVGDIPPTTQVKLLRVLETQAFERVGGTRTLVTDVRFVGATNRHLEELIGTGEFRQDLYFRLNVLPVELPPLRAHREDIPQLAQHFIQRCGRRSGHALSGLSRDALQRLMAHDWPGNIRELQNVIERAAAVYAQGTVLTGPEVAQALGRLHQAAETPDLNRRQQEVLRCLERAPDGCRVDELAQEIQRVGGRGGGCSARTLQNDLRQLAGRGYVVWVKDGSSRLYSLAPAGREQVRRLVPA